MSRRFLTPIVLPADPAVPMEAATKQYVDSKATAGVSEVEINPSDPIGTNPSAELWYDTDAPTVMDNDMRWYTAWGVVATASRSTSSPTASSAAYIDTGVSATFSQVAGRRYMLTVEALCVVSAVGGNLGVTITDAANNGIGAVGAVTPGAANAGTQNVVVGLIDAATSAAVTYKVRHNIQLAGTGYVYADLTAPIRLIVEDVGPSLGAVPVMPPTFDARWNTSWGVIATATGRGAGMAMPPGVVSSLTVPMPVTLQAGRRYRIACNVRAIQSGIQTTTQFQLWDNGANSGLYDYWHISATGSYDNCHIEAIVSGDGATHNYDVRVNPGPVSGTYNTAFWMDIDRHGFYVEDVGPVTGAVPVPNPTPAWIAPTLLNGWRNYTNGFTDAGYRLIGDRVEVRGMVIGGATGSAICQLPAGYRPTRAHIYAATMNDAYGQIRILTDGSINPTFPTPGSWVSIDSIWFSVT